MAEVARWWRSVKRRARRQWWWFVVLAVFAIIQDRVFGAANKWIDENAEGFLSYVRDILAWSTNDSLGIAGILLVATFVILMILSFFKPDEQSAVQTFPRQSSRKLKIGHISVAGKRTELELPLGHPTTLTGATPNAIYRPQIAVQEDGSIDFIELPTGEPKQTVVEFFPSIDSLRSKHPLPETFKPGNEIHAYFLSGEGIFAEHNDYIKCVKRLMLPRPDAENIATLNTFSSTYTDYRSQIRKYMDLAKKNNVPARLFQSFTGVSLLFCNPDRRDGWVQIGPIIPGSEASERHHYRIYKINNEATICALYRVFDRLWEASDAAAEDSKSSAAGDFISMKDAAVKFYADARTSRFIMAQAAEEMSGRNISRGSPEDILHYMATYISTKIPVYGKKAPSNTRERISPNDLGLYSFKQEGTRLEHLFYHTSADSVFTDIEVRRDQFEALIEQMHFESGYHDESS